MRKTKELGFDSIDGFVRANLHYLPKEKQALFYRLAGLDEISSCMSGYKKDKRVYSEGGYRG